MFWGERKILGFGAAHGGNGSLASCESLDQQGMNLCPDCRGEFVDDAD